MAPWAFNPTIGCLLGFIGVKLSALLALWNGAGFLWICQVFRDGGAEDPSTWYSTKFKRTEGVPTAAVGDLVPHPELHLDGMFRVSGGHGGKISCTSIGSDFVLVAVASLCWFLYNRWVQLCCIWIYVVYIAYYNMETFCPERVRKKVVTCWGRRMRREAWRHGQA